MGTGLISSETIRPVPKSIKSTIAPIAGTEIGGIRNFPAARAGSSTLELLHERPHYQQLLAQVRSAAR